MDTENQVNTAQGDAELETKGSETKSEQTFDINSILESPDFKKVIQAEVDRVRTKYSQEKKELEKQLQESRQKSMSKEELLAEKERTLAEFEAKVKKQSLDFETVKVLEEKKVSTKLLDFLKGDTIEERTQQLETLLSLIDAEASEKTKETFNSQGRDVKKTKDDQPVIKKYSEYSVDELIQIATDNPSLYEQIVNNK